MELTPEEIEVLVYSLEKAYLNSTDHSKMSRDYETASHLHDRLKEEQEDVWFDEHFAE